MRCLLEPPLLLLDPRSLAEGLIGVSERRILFEARELLDEHRELLGGDALAGLRTRDGVAEPLLERGRPRDELQEEIENPLVLSLAKELTKLGDRFAGFGFALARRRQSGATIRSDADRARGAAIIFYGAVRA